MVGKHDSPQLNCVHVGRFRNADVYCRDAESHYELKLLS